MTKAKKKDKKNCRSKKNLMLVFGFSTLLTRVISAVSLAVIAFGFCYIKKESKVFNECVEEVRGTGQSVSAAVRFCKGG